MVTYVSITTVHLNNEQCVHLRILPTQETMGVPNLGHLQFCDSLTDQEIFVFLQKQAVLLKGQDQKLLFGENPKIELIPERKVVIVRIPLIPLKEEEKKSELTKELIHNRFSQVMLENKIIPPIFGSCF